MSERQSLPVRPVREIVGSILQGMSIDHRYVPGETVRVRLYTLIVLRWLAILGQTIAVVGVYLLLGFEFPVAMCLLVVGISLALNLFLMLRYTPSKRLSVPVATGHLAFDMVQLFLLLALTGGLKNPFALLFLAPVTISATMLSLRSTLILGGLGFAFITVLGIIPSPLPWGTTAPPDFPPYYMMGVWAALVLGLSFNAVYAWRIAAEANRMQTALTATQQVLAREQRLAALGSLAAAAAHELGTPLATIALVAKELERDLPEGRGFREDVRLLREQANRCREILSRLSHQPGEGDLMLGQMPLGAVLEEVAAPHRDLGIAIDINIEPLYGGAAKEPKIWRRPELVYGLGNLVENAVDFARARVAIHASWTSREIRLKISDDGPGFAPDIMERLGEPYVSSRRKEFAMPDSQGEAESDEEGHYGMGLGFFIANTLLERTGAHVEVANSPGGKSPGERGGAVVTVTWPSEKLLREETAPAADV